MWLERFASGQTTPSGTSQHQWASGSASLRPVYNVRAPSSSTLVSNNSSTASLPLSTGRAQEGSSLKHEVRAAAEEEADAAAMASARAAPEDPLTVLQRLLDPLPARASDSANPTEPDSDVMPAPVQLPTYEESTSVEGPESGLN